MANIPLIKTRGIVVTRHRQPTNSEQVHWLANTYAKQGITINAVAPALITGTAMLPGQPEALTAKIPIGRLGKPEEIAETVLWMVKTGYVTNKVIAVDGGLFIQ